MIFLKDMLNSWLGFISTYDDHPMAKTNSKFFQCGMVQLKHTHSK